MVTAYQRQMDAALKIACLHDVPVEMVMHRDMLNNWRRRIKRLQRAGVRATDEGNTQRVIYIQMAHIRLVTGRFH